jgi:hypothetical protein
MAAAQGDYLIFMDDDDLTDADFISTLYATASQNDCDIAFSGFRTRDESTGNETLRPVPLDPSKPYSGEELALVHISGFLTYLWTMLFKRDFLVAEGLLCWDGCFADEDMEFLMRSLVSARKVAFSSACPYVYRLHEKMTSKTMYASPEQKIRRYAFKTMGRLRVARYMAERAASPKIAGIARNYLTPLYQLKIFGVYAWQGDKESFDNALRSPEIRSILLSARRTFFKEPGIFLKTLLLFAFPDMYYAYRRKHVDYARMIY